MDLPQSNGLSGASRRALLKGFCTADIKVPESGLCDGQWGLASGILLLMGIGAEQYANAEYTDHAKQSPGNRDYPI